MHQRQHQQNSACLTTIHRPSTLSPHNEAKHSTEHRIPATPYVAWLPLIQGAVLETPQSYVMTVESSHASITLHNVLPPHACYSSAGTRGRRPAVPDAVPNRVVCWGSRRNVKGKVWALTWGCDSLFTSTCSIHAGQLVCRALNTMLSATTVGQ